MDAEQFEDSCMRVHSWLRAQQIRVYGKEILEVETLGRDKVTVYTSPLRDTAASAREIRDKTATKVSLSGHRQRSVGRIAFVLWYT